MDCPFCAHTATRHFGHQSIYWFCNHCWQQVPDFAQTLPEHHNSLSIQCLSTWVQQRSRVEHIKSRSWSPSASRPKRLVSAS